MMRQLLQTQRSTHDVGPWYSSFGTCGEVEQGKKCVRGVVCKRFCIEAFCCFGVERRGQDARYVQCRVRSLPLVAQVVEWRGFKVDLVLSNWLEHRSSGEKKNN
jgi:hypothetical protein